MGVGDVPGKIPRVNWITLPARNGGEPIYGRCGLQHRVLLHLSIHEEKVGTRVVSRGFNWWRHVVDGESAPRERMSRPAPRPARRDSDDEDERRRGRGRDNSSSRNGWGARIRRSLSRNHRQEPRDQEWGRDDRDRRDGRGNRRHAAEGAPPALTLGSGSSSDAARSIEGAPAAPLQLPLLHPASDVDTLAGQLDLQVALAPARGRSPARVRSPRAARRRSQESLMPPVSPPLSPTTVFPLSPRSKRDEPRRSTAIGSTPSQAMMELCSPMVLLLPLASPAKPPGFERSPTLVLASSGPLRRTPSPARNRVVVVADADLTPLFAERQGALLPSPASPPPKKPSARRKTLAGVTIARTGGFVLQRTSARLQATGRAKATPVAKAAEALVCRGLGITKDGEDVTVDMLNAFTERFKEQLPPEVIAAMHDMFKLDNPQVAAVEEAL